MKQLTKAQEQQIVTTVRKILGASYRQADLHSDDIDNAAADVACKFNVDEDTVRYLADLPRL